MPSSVQRKVPLAQLTTLGLGGPADELIELHDERELSAILSSIRERGVAVTMLGGGSNIIVSDAGIRGVVLAMRTRGIVFDDRGEHVFVTAAAGEPWDDFVAATVNAGLAGIECLSGIPGLVGATPIQNVGAYGQEVADVITSLRACDVATGQMQTYAHEQCEFSYRDSRFRRALQKEIILSVTFRLSKAAPAIPKYAELARLFAGHGAPDAKQIREAVIDVRRSKSMVIDARDENHRSVGSFFTNPIVSVGLGDAVLEIALKKGLISQSVEMPRYASTEGFAKLSAAWLIEKSGIAKGTRRANVGVSSKHSLALVHHGGGTTAELLAFAQEIKAQVHAAFGVELSLEPIMLGDF